VLTEAGVEMLKRYLADRGGSVVFFRGKARRGRTGCASSSR